MQVIKLGDRDYPKNLSKIYNPPKELYVLGNIKILNEFGIGIVGTRRTSEYGRKVARSLGFGLSKHGVNIISGMAIGIDTEAHMGSIMAKGKTIAVIGSGFRTYLSKRK